MIRKGRKSTAEMSVVTTVHFNERPSPPDELNERQAEIWKEIVASEEPRFFSTAALKSLLVSYCQRKEAAELISKVISTFKPEWLRSEDGAKRYKELLQMRDLEMRGFVGIATKLRLTNQSRYTPQAAATAAKHAVHGTRPWEF